MFSPVGGAGLRHGGLARLGDLVGMGHQALLDAAPAVFDASTELLDVGAASHVRLGRRSILGDSGGGEKGGRGRGECDRTQGHGHLRKGAAETTAARGQSGVERLGWRNSVADGMDLRRWSFSTSHSDRDASMAAARKSKAIESSGAVSLLIADVDGTLVTEEKILTRRARAAVRALKDKGIAFAITSGRPPRGMAMLVKPLALTTPIAGFNGGVYVHPDMRVIRQNTLSGAAARKAVKLIGDQGLDVWVYTADAWLIRDKAAPHVAREQWTVKFPPKLVRDFDAVLDKAVKIVGISDDLERVTRCEEAAQKALGHAASAARSQPYYLDITHPQANKGAVVDTLSRMLAVPPSRIATIGDMPNDVPMFKKSGLSVAMGNASVAVQKQARHVTASYNDEGFAKAVERFVLGLDAHQNPRELEES
jgi:Cof subfamily protein (haloacid dehalogenase superfamily)